MTRRGFLLFCAAPAAALAARRRRRPKVLYCEATAHSVEGVTAAGTRSRPGTAAADPDVFPIGTRVRIMGAGRYSGVYSIEDTGTKVAGRHLDLYMRSNAEAKRFGRQRVKVVVLKYGDGEVKTASAKARSPLAHGRGFCAGGLPVAKRSSQDSSSFVH